jgi:hypothetical protein
MNIESAALQLLTESWTGRAARFRVNKLAAALGQPIEDVQRAVTALRDAGAIFFTRGDGGPHLHVRNAPAEPNPTRFSSDFSRRP